MMSNKRLLLCVGSIIAFVLISTIAAAPQPRSESESYYNEIEDAPDALLMALVDRFGETIMRARKDLENSKRTVDFGLARGFSGTQEAKHRMGLAAASFPGGPGRRRRTDEIHV